MRQRLKLEKDGTLRDRDGNPVARIVSMTVEWGLGGSPLEPSTDDHGRLQAFAVDAGTTNAVVAREADDPREVWDHYVAVMEPRRKDLDAQTRAVIRDALKVATKDECVRAIDGCAASSFHMGSNDRGKKYNRITHILKGKRGVRTTREQIDLFLDILEDQSGRQSQFPSEGDERVRDAKRALLDAVEFPDDETIQARAMEAREWLEGQGWRVEFGSEAAPPILIEPTQ